MYVFAHIIPLGNRIKDIIRHILRVRSGETDTHAREFLRDYLKQLGKCGDVFILVDKDNSDVVLGVSYTNNAFITIKNV